MRNHTELLNTLAERYQLKKYLEIGVFHRSHNLSKIRCPYKIGVDPAAGSGADFIGTSDEYFEEIAGRDVLFDLIFIDGLHHADQVKKDFENSLRHLAPNGFIVLHDCNPQSEDVARVPRAGKKGAWLGDVYKFICSLPTYDGIDFRTGNFDHGCCVVWRADRKAEKVPVITNYKQFTQNRHLIRLASPVELMQGLPALSIA